MKHFFVNIAKVLNGALVLARPTIALARPTFWLSATLLIISVLCGCGTNPTNAVGASGSSSSGGGSGAGSGSGSGSSGTATSNPIAAGSIYVPSDTHSPGDTILTVPTIAMGASAPTAILSGSKVSVDDSGNIYLLANGSAAINVLAQAAPNGLPIRTLPVGTGSQIATVVDMQASSTGELFVSDGVGIAVFDSKATGSAAPARYIKGVTASSNGQSIVPGLIAVDRLDNVYVVNRNDSTVAVFGSAANGTVVPSRVISGGLTVMPSGSLTMPLIYSMSTDVSGDLYVFCYCSNPANQNDIGILEYAPSAAGNAPPIRWVTDPAIDPNTGGTGIAVDAAGTIFLSSGTENGTQMVFEFATLQSGTVSAANTVTINDWLSDDDSRLAVH